LELGKRPGEALGVKKKTFPSLREKGVGRSIELTVACGGGKEKRHNGGVFRKGGG